MTPIRSFQLVFMLFCWSGISADLHAAKPQLNVLLIMTDDLNNDLDC
jgi:hypothetical protein